MKHKLIAPIVDFCAKEILDNDIVRRYFISAVLNIPVEKIKKTKVLNPFLNVLRKKDKQGILDVAVELDDGTKIDIEIQVRQQKFWDKRNVYYLAKLYTKGFYLGSSYEKLNRCISICILDFNFLEGNQSHSVFRLRDEQGKDYTDIIEIHLIELKKLKTEKNKFVHQNLEIEHIKENNVEEWIRFFQCRTEEDVTMLLRNTKNPGIKEAIKELNLINASDILRARYEAKMKSKSDRDAEDAYVLEQGIKQGMSQGEDNFAMLTEKLIQNNRIDDLQQATKDKKYRQKLYKEYKINRQNMEG